MPKQIATLILEHPRWGILTYLRDNKPTIPYPHHWDLFGGHVDPDETVEEALVRELKEELNLDLKAYQFFRKYEVRDLNGESDNDKFVFYAPLSQSLEDLTLYEGERLAYYTREEIPSVNFANMLGKIVQEYMESVPVPGEVY